LVVGDVGSGAGLPGIALAIARPDLRIELIEPMERRTAFLQDVIADLGLAGVTVLRSRGEDAPRDRYDVVTARAVAPLVRLVPMALPLARLGGTLLAIKGAQAAGELQAATGAIAAAGGGRGTVQTAGVGVIEPATSVVSIERQRMLAPSRRQTAGGRRG
jgi:16S rRNA (guanine527-N7)-methyltransferase